MMRLESGSPAPIRQYVIELVVTIDRTYIDESVRAIVVDRLEHAIPRATVYVRKMKELEPRR